ncbi:hypothetical protein LTR56_012390 [Elasticomyces elasticus]|nr:hypothetical protein LTR56_012390 [Elasticomyces elasticus]KAK3652350.1 hypothetical protein LTR22_011704 [Elasticomyces elasticus]KAK4919008.1 hypothetical protein LTR49_013325 [Elasticomyces elasticus]KAK5756641.1 hypothetical protein LTS12_013231 [Elasticomyces elasticus]
MAPSLVSLPTELLEMIAEASAASGPDPVPVLRMTCREIQQKLDRRFTEFCFAVRYVCLDERKLRELCALSKVSRLATQVEALVVLCRPAEDARYVVFHFGSGWSTWKEFDLALQRLVNLREIDFTDMTMEKAREDRLMGRPRPYGELDFSIAFATFMLAFEKRETTLRAITCYGQRDEKMRSVRPVGLSDTESLLHLNSALVALQSLTIKLLLPRYPRENGLDSGIKAGNDLCAALQNCPELNNLSLELSKGRDASAAFNLLATSALLPKLKRFDLWKSWCTIQDLTLFFSRHSATIQRCDLREVSMASHAGSSGFNDMLEFMGKKLKLSHLALSYLKLGRCYVEFPAMSTVYCDDGPDAEGWVMVEIDERMRLNGHEEVQEGIARMQECVQFKNYDT